MFQDSGHVHVHANAGWVGYAYLESVQMKYRGAVAVRCGAVPFFEDFIAETEGFLTDEGVDLPLFVETPDGRFRGAEFADEGDYSVSSLKSMMVEAECIEGSMDHLARGLGLFVLGGGRGGALRPEGPAASGLSTRREVFVVLGGSPDRNGVYLEAPVLPHLSVPLGEVAAGLLSEVQFFGNSRGDYDDLGLILGREPAGFVGKERGDGKDALALFGMAVDTVGGRGVSHEWARHVLRYYLSFFGGRTLDAVKGLGYVGPAELSKLSGYCYLPLFSVALWPAVVACFGCAPAVAPVGACYDLLRVRGHTPVVQCGFTRADEGSGSGVVHMWGFRPHVQGDKYMGLPHVGVVGAVDARVLTAVRAAIERGGAGEVDSGAYESGLDLVVHTAGMLDAGRKRELAMLEARGDALLTYLLASEMAAAGASVQQYQEQRSIVTSNSYLAKTLLGVFPEEVFVKPAGVSLATGKVGGKVLESFIGALDAGGGQACARAFCRGVGLIGQRG